jgi:hypothetical protein
MIKKLIEIAIEKRTKPYQQYIDIIDQKLTQYKDELNCIINALEKEKSIMLQYYYQPTTEQIEKIEAEIRDNILPFKDHPLNKYIVEVIDELNCPYGNEKDDNGYSAIDNAIINNPAIEVIGSIISTFWLLDFDFININREADRQKYLYAIEAIQKIDKSIDYKKQILNTGGITKDKIMRSSFFSITKILNDIGLSENKKSDIANELLDHIFDNRKIKKGENTPSPIRYRITTNLPKGIDYLDLNTLYYYA